MQLQMSQGANGVQTLQAGDNTILTGPMGDCVSVIVLYNLVGNQYQNARGQHGLGGIEVVHFPTLLAGVPNLAASQVIIIPGTLQQSDYARDNIMQYATNAVVNVAGLANANIRLVMGRSQATVNRQGQVL